MLPFERRVSITWRRLAVLSWWSAPWVLTGWIVYLRALLVNTVAIFTPI
jgi:ABC-type amino acid transport substrate-binding protein